MTLPVFSSSITPQYGAARSSKPRFKKIQFGDGYQQRSSDGFNTNLKTHSLTFKGGYTDVLAIETFLNARTTNGLEAFTWTNLENVAISVICEEWSVTYDDFGWGTLSANFEQVAEV